MNTNESSSSSEMKRIFTSTKLGSDSSDTTDSSDSEKSKYSPLKKKRRKIHGSYTSSLSTIAEERTININPSFSSIAASKTEDDKASQIATLIPRESLVEDGENENKEIANAPIRKTAPVKRRAARVKVVKKKPVRGITVQEAIALAESEGPEFVTNRKDNELIMLEKFQEANKPFEESRKKKAEKRDKLKNKMAKNKTWYMYYQHLKQVHNSLKEVERFMNTPI